MNNFLTNNEIRYKVWRTIVQAVISFLIVNGGANLLEILGHIPMDDWLKTIIFGIIMAILTALMPYIGNSNEPMNKEELPRDYWEGGGEDE